MTNHIILSTETIASFSDSLKSEIASALGLPVAAPAAPASDAKLKAEELGIQTARAFLLGCSDRTAEVLELIVQMGGTFSIRELEKRAKAPVGGLRGVWTGLTKRVRTITRDENAQLIDWDGPDQENNYVGRLSPITVDAFRRALAE